MRDERSFFPEKVLDALNSVYGINFPLGYSYTHLRLPRQVGKTTAVVEFFMQHDNVLLIAPTMNVKQYVLDMIKETGYGFSPEKRKMVVCISEFDNWKLGRSLQETYFWVYEAIEAVDGNHKDVQKLMGFYGNRNGVLIT